MSYARLPSGNGYPSKIMTDDLTVFGTASLSGVSLAGSDVVTTGDISATNITSTGLLTGASCALNTVISTNTNTTNLTSASSNLTNTTLLGTTSIASALTSAGAGTSIVKTGSGFPAAVKSLANGTKISWSFAADTVTAALTDEGGVTPGSYVFSGVTVSQQGVVTAVETNAAAGSMTMGFGVVQAYGPGSGWVTVTTPFTGASVSGNITATVASGIFTVTKTGLYRYGYQMPLYKDMALTGGTGAFFVGPSVDGVAPAVDHYYPLYDAQIPLGAQLCFIGNGIVSLTAGQTFGIQLNNGFAVGTVTVANYNGHMSLDRVA